MSNLSFVSEDRFEDLNKNLNQLQGLAAFFMAINLEIVTPGEHAGAAWLLSDLVEKVENTIHTIEEKIIEAA